MISILIVNSLITILTILFFKNKKMSTWLTLLFSTIVITVVTLGLTGINMNLNFSIFICLVICLVRAFLLIVYITNQLNDKIFVLESIVCALCVLAILPIIYYSIVSNNFNSNGIWNWLRSIVKFKLS